MSDLAADDEDAEFNVVCWRGNGGATYGRTDDLEEARRYRDELNDPADWAEKQAAALAMGMQLPSIEERGVAKVSRRVTDWNQVPGEWWEEVTDDA